MSVPTGSRPHASPIAARRRRSGIVLPGVEEDDAVGLGQVPKAVDHARPQHGALAHAALAIEDGEARSHQVAGNHLALAVAPEEELDVELRVVERRESLVRAGRRSHGATCRAGSSARRCESDWRYSSTGTSKRSIPRWRQSSRSMRSAPGTTAQDR